MDVEVLKKELEELTGQPWQKSKRAKGPDEAFMYCKEERTLISIYTEPAPPVLAFHADDQKIKTAPLLISGITQIKKKGDEILFYVDYLPFLPKLTRGKFAASVKFF